MTLGNKYQWNFKQNAKLFINENAPENIVCEMAAILTRRRWVDARWHMHYWITIVSRNDTSPHLFNNKPLTEPMQSYCDQHFLECILIKLNQTLDFFSRKGMLPKDMSHLINWGPVMHICVSKLTIIGSDNGLSPDRHQAIIWTNAGILIFGPLGTNFSEILIEIHVFSFKKMHLKMSSGKWQPFCLGLNVLIPTSMCQVFSDCSSRGNNINPLVGCKGHLGSVRPVLNFTDRQWTNCGIKNQVQRNFTTLYRLIPFCLQFGMTGCLSTFFVNWNYNSNKMQLIYSHIIIHNKVEEYCKTTKLTNFC